MAASRGLATLDYLIGHRMSACSVVFIEVSNLAGAPTQLHTTLVWILYKSKGSEFL